METKLYKVPKGDNEANEFLRNTMLGLSNGEKAQFVYEGKTLTYIRVVDPKRPFCEYERDASEIRMLKQSEIKNKKREEEKKEKLEQAKK